MWFAALRRLKQQFNIYHTVDVAEFIFIINSSYRYDAVIKFSTFVGNLANMSVLISE